MKWCEQRTTVSYFIILCWKKRQGRWRHSCSGFNFGFGVNNKLSTAVKSIYRKINQFYSCNDSKDSILIFAQLKANSLVSLDDKKRQWKEWCNTKSICYKQFGKSSRVNKYVYLWWVTWTSYHRLWVYSHFSFQFHLTQVRCCNHKTISFISFSFQNWSELCSFLGN